MSKVGSVKWIKERVDAKYEVIQTNDKYVIRRTMGKSVRFLNNWSDSYAFLGVWNCSPVIFKSSELALGKFSTYKDYFNFRFRTDMLKVVKELTL